jgi:hypothetical protein
MMIQFHFISFFILYNVNSCQEISLNFIIFICNKLFEVEMKECNLNLNKNNC